MTIRQVLLLAITPVALAVFGLAGIQSARGLAAGVGDDSVTVFVRDALDRPDKLTPEHLTSVLRSAATIEAMERNARASNLAAFESFATGCLGLAGLSAATIALAVAAGRRNRASGLAEPPPPL